MPGQLEYSIILLNSVLIILTIQWNQCLANAVQINIYSCHYSLSQFGPITVHRLVGSRLRGGGMDGCFIFLLKWHFEILNTVGGKK